MFLIFKTETHLIVCKLNNSGWIQLLNVTKNVQPDQNNKLQSFQAKIVQINEWKQSMYSFLEKLILYNFLICLTGLKSMSYKSVSYKKCVVAMRK